MNLSGVGYENGTQTATTTPDEPPRGAALAQQLRRLAAEARTHTRAAIRQARIALAVSSHRRRLVRELRVNGAVDDAEVRDLLAWAEVTLRPKARWHRLGGLAAALVFLVFVVFWPFMVLIGAGLGFGGALVCYVAVLGATTPFALLGERDKARDVIETLGPQPRPDGWNPNVGRPIVWPG